MGVFARKPFFMRTHEEFANSKLHGKSKSSHNIVVSAYKSADLTHAKFGIIATKKIGNAVVRNKLRRRVKNLILADLKLLQSQPYYFVIILRKNARQASFSTLKQDWSRILKQFDIQL